MRLRNVPEAKNVVAKSEFVIHGPENHRGRWKTSPARPLILEIGTGKGKFIMETALRHPENDYLGLERYESVLYRACEKMEGIPARDPASLMERAKGSAGHLPEEAEGGSGIPPEGEGGGLETGTAGPGDNERTGFKPPENLHFLSMDARDLRNTFSEGEVDGIYLNFSDPWPKARHAKRRLTSKTFLAVYEGVLKDGGWLEFKTDNRALFDFSLEEIGSSPHWKITAVSYDLHHDAVLGRGNIMTEYERKFSALGNKICKLTTVLDADNRAAL